MRPVARDDGSVTSTPEQDPEQDARHRLRVAIVCVGLLTLALIQDPGRVVADTKLDLVVDPGRFLTRALEMWDPDGFLGQLQNQAYGYLFPMGPFFWAWEALTVDPWIVQRLWWATLWVVAFLGFLRLGRALGIGSPTSRLLAGLVFALSPRILTLIGPSSVEAWPSALAPWVLLPLVLVAQGANVRRASALSALAVAAAGGVNGAATFAVIPLAALWIVVGLGGRERRQAMLWWPPLVVLATSWWLIPLFLLGAYSPPFLDYIESASITTTAATAFDALRGTTHWVPFVADAALAGRAFQQDSAVIVNAGALVVLGVLGIAMAGAPHRRFLFLGVTTGLVLVTLGHTGAVSGWGAETIQGWLDGVLAPIRNTHKFDVVVRLPLALGAAHAVAVLAGRTRVDRESRIQRAAVALIAVSAVVGATAPAWGATLPYRGSIEGELPGYWDETAQWLAERDGTALLAPSSAFADYLWGSTGDEPLQPLARSTWVVRNSVPLTPGATIRMLDSLSVELEKGSASDGLAPALRRAGIDYLVLRNDLRPDISDGRVEVAYRTVAASDGLSVAESFGPPLGGQPLVDLDTERTFANGGWQVSRAAIQIFAVDQGQAPPTQTPARTPTVVGAPESLVSLDDLGVLDGESVVLAQDEGGEGRGPLVLTDGLRRQEVAFGAVTAQRGASLSADQEPSLDRRVHDYVEAGEEPWISVPRLRGAVALEASGARSSVGTPGPIHPSAGPWSAFDGDQRSAWQADERRGSITLRLTERVDLGTVTLTTGLPPGIRQRMQVETESGTATVLAIGSNPVRVDVGEVSAVDISGVNLDAGRFQLAEVFSPSLRVARTLQVRNPDATSRLPLSIVLGLDQGRRPGCLEIAGVPRCRSDLGDRGEDAYSIDRLVTVPTASAYDLRIRTTPLGGVNVDRILQGTMSAQTRVSSTVNDDVRSGATQAVDGDANTGWIAHPEDSDPTLEIRWDEAQRVSAVRLTTARSLPASTPDAVSVEFDDGSQRLAGVDDDGLVRFPEKETSLLRLRLATSGDARDSDGLGQSNVLPVGVSEVVVPGVDLGSPRSGPDVVEMRCGSGPTLTVDGRVTRTRVTTSPNALSAGRDATARPCGDTAVELRAGPNRLQVAASSAYDAGRVVLELEDDESSQVLSARDADGSRYLPAGHNANPGWQAEAGGRALQPLVLNGWEQGWVLPEGVRPSDVTESFAPSSTYRAGLGVGIVGVLVVISLALWRGRRRAGTTRHRGTVVPATLVGGAGLLTLGLLGGTTFVLLGLVGGMAALLASRRAGPVPLLVAVVAPLTVTLLAYTVWPWGTTDVWIGEWAWPQLLVGVSLGALTVAVLRGDHPLRARNGLSTKR